MSLHQLSLAAAVLGAVALSACAHAPPRWAAVEADDVTRDSDPGQDAVVLSDVGHLRFLDADRPSAGYTLTRHVRVKILTGAGRRFARVLVPTDHWTELVHLVGRSVAPGKTGGSWFSEKDAVSFARTGSGISYPESRQTAVDIPVAGVDRVVEWEVTTESHQAFAIEPWVFSADVPVRLSRFEVEVPTGWELKAGYTARGAPATLEPARTVGDGHELFVWQEKDLPALEPEPMGLPTALVAHRLQLSVARAPTADPDGVLPTWSAVGAWYRRLIAGMDGLASESDAEVARYLAAHPGDPRQRLFELVRDEIRYAAIYVGVGALRPHPAAAVFTARFGDCKDMATLLTALYRRHGIEAHHVLVGTRNAAMLHPDLPTAAAFNHDIVAVRRADGGLDFADPTAKSASFGEVPWAIQGQPALLVLPDKGELITLPRNAAEQNSETVRWTIPAPDATTAATEAWSLEIRSSGVYAEGWRGRLRAATDARRLERDVRRRLLGELTGARVVSAALEDRGVETLIRAELQVPHLPRTSRGQRVVPLGALFGSNSEVLVPAERESPVELDHARVLVEELVVARGASEALVHLPQRQAVKSDVGESRIEAEEAPTEVRVRRTLRLTHDRVAASALPDLRALSEATAADGREAIIFATGGHR